MGGKGSMKQALGIRRLILVLGDQLDRKSVALEGIDPSLDVLFLAEVRSESTHVWSHKARTALFLAAMRHFTADCRKSGLRVDHVALTDPANSQNLAGELRRAIRRHQPGEVVMVEPGDYRVRQDLLAVLVELGQAYRELADNHFLCSRADFASHAKGRKQLRLEYFYRPMRERYGILMNQAGPEGGSWNFDTDNRGSFGKAGPGLLPEPLRFSPDAVTREVLDLVAREFGSHPGSIEAFDWPVTPDQASEAVDDFITHRLPWFGTYQDAMWLGQPWLYHSRISTSLNLKLISPLTVCQRAEAAYRAGQAPLAAVEGFIRQILGWREYVRGIYWLHMPGYLDLNALGAEQPLPAFYWTGDTEMACLRDAIGQTLRLGYAHHIQRLMVTGLFALLLGVRPREVHAWYLAVYVDAVEWVELPNTLGMSQYADGGIMASKPYAATGKYIQRMGNHCQNCRYKPAESTGPTACPFTTLYWDFLDRHEKSLVRNPRMSLQVKNLTRMTEGQRLEIRQQAGRLRLRMAAP